MKRALITAAVVTIGTLYGSSQTLTQAGNALRQGDEIAMQLVTCPDNGTDGPDVLWDFSGMEVLGDYPVIYTAADSAHRDATIGWEPSTRYYYHADVQGVFLAGHANRLSRIDYDIAEQLLRFPMQLGDTLSGVFHGCGTYSGRLATRNYGRYTTRAAASGTLILPDGDTLRNVLRLHTERLVSSHYWPVSRKDSIGVYSADSITIHLQADTACIQTTIDRWYAEGYRYPIVETRRTGTTDGETTYFQLALYCPPSAQAQLPADEENLRLREQLAARGSVPSAPGQPSAMTRCDVTVSGGTITVGYDLQSDATVRALVCNTQGMVYRQQSQTNGAGTGYQLTLNCNGLRPGDYVLYLNVNGQIQSRKVNL